MGQVTSEKIGTPYVFLQPLKLATSNLVHNLGLVLGYQKQRLGQKLAGVWAKGASKQNLGPPTYFYGKSQRYMSINVKKTAVYTQVNGE